MLVAGVVALLSAWNAAMFAASRLLYALAQDGALPSPLARVHPKNGTPSNAVVFVGVIALLGGLMGRAFIEPLVQIGAMGFAVAFIGACLSSLALRRGADARRFPVFAAWAGALALGGVATYSAWTILANVDERLPEAAALALWAGLGAAMWIFARTRKGRVS